MVRGDEGMSTAWMKPNYPRAVFALRSPRRPPRLGGDQMGDAAENGLCLRSHRTSTVARPLDLDRDVSGHHPFDRRPGFSDPNSNAPRGRVGQENTRDVFGQGFDQGSGRPFDDAPNQLERLGIVDRPTQIVALAGRAKVEEQRHVDDEPLTQSALFRIDAVVAVEGEVTKDDLIVFDQEIPTSTSTTARKLRRARGPR